jgi:hypothetical protein
MVENLSIFDVGGVGYGALMPAGSDHTKDLFEKAAQQFKVTQNDQGENKFDFQSALNNMYFMCRENKLAQAAMEGKNDMSRVEITLLTDMPEDGPTVVEYDEELMAKYPCPEALSFAKDIFYTPVVIATSSNQLLKADGEKTCFKGSKSEQEQNQWIICPKENGSVMIRSKWQSAILSIWCDKGPNKGVGWTYTSAEDEGVNSEFKLEAFPNRASENSFALRTALNNQVLHLEYVNKCAASTLETPPQSEFTIVPVVTYDEKLNEIQAASNEKNDAWLKSLVEEHWKREIAEFNVVKRDYNQVFKVTFKDNGQVCFGKAKPISDVMRDRFVKLGNDEMVFVDYVAKQTGLTSTFVTPGVVNLKWLSMQIVTCEKGQGA